MNTMQPNNTFAKALLKTGFIAGLLDILSAFVSFYISTGKNPLIVLNYVASAVVGKPVAYAGGAEMRLLGLLLHFLVAYIFTAFFFWIYPGIKFLSKNIFLTAFLFGMFAWTVMNLVVVPMTKAPVGAFRWDNAVKNMLILVVMIGLPVAYFAKRFYRDRRQ